MAKTGRPYSDSNGQWQPPCFSYRRMWLILLVGLTQFMPSAVVYNSLLRWYYHVAL